MKFHNNTKFHNLEELSHIDLASLNFKFKYIKQILNKLNHFYFTFGTALAMTQIDQFRLFN